MNNRINEVSASSGGNIAITKLQMNKIYAGEYKEVHSRSMQLDTSYNAVNFLSYALNEKMNNKLTVADLAQVPEIITYSDRPSASPVEVNGGWNQNRYAFMMEITILETATTINRVYLSGYTDRDDVFSFTGEINPEINLIFNDVLVTKSIMDLSTGVEVTRIVTAAEILPTPERFNDRDVTLTPSDVFKMQQGMSYVKDEPVNSYGAVDTSARATMIDMRIKNNGGKISRKTNASLDNHLVSVANNFLQERGKDEYRTDEDVISDLTFSSREPDIRQTIALFRILDQRGVSPTNTVRLGDLMDIAPFWFRNPESDYLISERQNSGMPDIEIQSLAREDRTFNALTTTDSISTASTDVETKMCFMLLQEIMSIMSLYKVTSVAVTMTNRHIGRDGRPMICVPRFDSFVRASDLSTSLYESFREACYGILSKLTLNGIMTVEASVYIGFSSEKCELSVEGGHSIVLSLPRFMSSHYTNVVGSITELKDLSIHYSELFHQIGQTARTHGSKVNNYENSQMSRNIF